MLKTSTSYDRACMEELQRVAARTFARESVRNRRGGAFAAGVILVAGGLGVFLWTGAYWPLAVCVVGLFPLLWSIFYYPFTGWASSKNLGKDPVSCDFFMERREVLVTQGNKQERFHYAQCARLVEAEDNIFLLMDSGRCLIFSKANLMGGSVEDLRALLKEKTGKPLEWLGRGRPPEGFDGTKA